MAGKELAIQESDFWRQMYEQVADKRRTEHERAERYKERALQAEHERAKLRKAVTLIGVLAAAGLNAIFWVQIFLG